MKPVVDVDFLQFLGDQEQQFIVGLDQDRTGIVHRFSHGVEAQGDTLPWRKTHDHVRFRPGEVTLWAGINGHGKSMVLSHVTAHFIEFSKALVASMEMSIEALGYRLIRQQLASSTPTEELVQASVDWCCDDRLWVYDQLDTVASERILGMCVYAMEKLGIDHIIIDSLMKCGIGPEDYEAQSAFVDRLCWAAKTHGGHIHLVHHVRKGQDEDAPPNKFDVKGSGAITDMVDNVLIVHRNKRKERNVEKGKEVERLEPDARLTVEKQRHGEWEGGISLYWHNESYQYLSGPDCKPTFYGALREKFR